MTVKFEEYAGASEDVLWVHEDPARLYRGLKDLLVDEIGVDRIEEGHMEFNVEKPKDRVRMWAYKEKSPHTEIMYKVSLKCKAPRDIYKMDRDDEIFKARSKISAKVITVFPGGDAASWTPKFRSQYPDLRDESSGLINEDLSSWHRSKPYEILVGIWYNLLYSREIDRYEQEGTHDVQRLLDILREKFGVERRIGKHEKSEYTPPWSR